MKKYITQHTIAAALIGLVVGGVIGSFGMTEFRMITRGGPGAAGFAGRAGGTGGTMRGGGFTSGEVIAKDATSITVKAPNGSSKIVLVSPSVLVSASAPGSLADVTIGTNVLVTGAVNADQSVTAQNIQTRPATSTPPYRP